MKKAGRALEFVSDNLRGDKQVVMTAVGQVGAALEYSRTEMRGDKNVVLAAVKLDIDWRSNMQARSYGETGRWDLRRCAVRQVH